MTTTTSSLALDRLFRSHYASLVRHLTPWTRSRESAREIAQEAFAHLLKLPQLPPASALPAYLWRTATNLNIDVARRKRAHENFIVHASLTLARAELSAQVISCDRERLAKIDEAMRRLPGRCQQAFMLHVFDGLTFGKVGQEMKISSRMAQKHVARALEYLQSCLDGEN